MWRILGSPGTGSRKVSSCGSFLLLEVGLSSNVEVVLEGVLSLNLDEGVLSSNLESSLWSNPVIT